MRNTENLLTAQPMGGALAHMQGNGSGWPFADVAEDSQRQSKIDWGVYWRSVYKRRWPILGAAVVLTVIAMLYAQSVQPVFRSTSTVLIESGKSKIVSIEEVYNGVSQDREYYQTQVEILRSRDVALRTVNTMKLWDEPEFDPRKPVRSLQGRIKDFFSPPSIPQVWTPELLADATVGKFLQGLTVDPVRLSQLVKISFDATDKELAAKLADATAISFIEADRDARQKLNVLVTGQLQERLAALGAKLRQSEQDLQKYREDQGIVSSAGTADTAGLQMNEISQRLIAAQSRRTEAESTYQQAAKSGASPSSPGAIEARSRVASASARLSELTQTLGDNNSKVIEARSALSIAQREQSSLSGSYISSLRADVEAARSTETALANALARARGAVQAVNRQEFQLGVLERDVQTNKQLYDLVLSRTKETGVSTNLQSAVARIVDPASAASAPLRPNKPQIVLVTLMMTLTAGALLSILIDKLSNTMQGSDEAEHRLHVPVLATLPEVHSAVGQSLSRLYLDDPKSMHAEGIRTARTNMLLSNFVVAHNKLILITSALAGEGKTTFCTNLAFAHAQTKRTLLIDCDLRNPTVGTQLGLPRDAKGIANLVLGDSDLKDCVHTIPGSSLLVMPAGDISVQPEELLLSVPFLEALRSLANRVDLVLIDSPAVGECSDALIISQWVNDTIFVVKARETPHAQAQRGLERLRRAGASVLGLVLTNMDTKEKWSPRRQAITTVYGDSRTVGETTALGA